MEDDAFIDSLGFDELKKDYIRERDKALAPIEQKYKANYKQLIDAKSKGIQEDQYHRRILNACIFPFSESGAMPDLGYHFVRASPLYEKGETNLDFLIYNPGKKIAIIGEAKGSVNNVGDVVDQTKKRIIRVKENIDYFNMEYLHSASSSTEFVIGVPWSISNELMKAVLRKGGEIIVWQAGSDLEDETELTIITPSKDTNNVYQTMRHQEDILNKALKGVRTSYNFKTFFLESHSVAKMLVLTLVDKGKPDKFFDFDDLLMLVKEELDYLDEQTARIEAQKIIRLGEDIGFVGHEEGKYYIKSRSKKANVREEALKKAWINWRIESDKEKEIRSLLDPIQAKYEEKKRGYKTLTEY